MSGAVFVPRNSWQPAGASVANRLRDAGTAGAFIRSLSPAAREALRYKWDFWARPAQMLPPPEAVPAALGWKYWLVLAGRGYGKTRVAAEALRDLVAKKKVNRIALVGPTYRDVVQTMIRGESGLESVFPANGSVRPRFVKNDNAVYFERGRERLATAFVYTGEEPERLRGPQHDFAWFDELGAFKYAVDVWRLFIAGHRLGPNPRALLTTTPRATLLSVNGLLDHDRTLVTTGRTQENRDNLAPDTVETLESVYVDTDFADQELGGVLRLDDAGSLFKVAHLASGRVPREQLQVGPSGASAAGVPLVKFAVVVDPSGSSKDSACECGVVVMALGADNKAYLLEDLSKRCSPDEWATRAVMASKEWYGAPVVYEKNFGDEVVGALIRRVAGELGLKVSTIPVEAKEDKVRRAMLVSPLVQKQRARLVGFHGPLEKQLTTWQPGTGKSPDRLDAFVWGAMHLLLRQVARGSFG